MATLDCCLFFQVSVSYNYSCEQLIILSTQRTSNAIPVGTISKKLLIFRKDVVASGIKYTKLMILFKQAYIFFTENQDGRIYRK